jgi:nucleotide-binding universal stress UspA family protein
MPDSPDLSRRPLLVFGDDGTEPADVAWRWITNQVWSGWHLDVLTADTEGTPIEWGAPPLTLEWTPTWARSEEVEGAGSLRFMKVATDPRAMLAERDEADLLVLGLRIHRFLQGMVTGSTTEWLLHHPPAPMVVARSPEEVRKVTVCVDGSEHARVALEAFASLPLAAKSLVTVLSIADGRTDAEGVLAGAASALQGRVAELDTAVREGKPTAEILDYLDEHAPEMVVLGTRGLTGWHRLALGSSASAVVRGAPCTSLIASTDTR